jgi:hypothetical protein
MLRVFPAGAVGFDIGGGALRKGHRSCSFKRLPGMLSISCCDWVHFLQQQLAAVDGSVACISNGYGMEWAQPHVSIPAI